MSSRWTLTVIWVDTSLDDWQAGRYSSLGMRCSGHPRPKDSAVSFAPVSWEAVKQNAVQGSKAETCCEMVTLHLVPAPLAAHSSQELRVRCNVQPAM